MQLPYDPELTTPEALLEWIKDEQVEVAIEEFDRYPLRPLLFSEYQHTPPKIVVYRYLPMEDWLNLISQQQVGYYGPWYYLQIAYQFYFHLELNGLYEIERKWYHRLLGQRSSLEERAHYFTQQILATPNSPERFLDTVEKSFRPGV